jgi:hypothetical protein
MRTIKTIILIPFSLFIFSLLLLIEGIDELNNRT